jgi:hypothetical protein
MPKRIVLTIPAGAIIEVICGPVLDNLWMVEVRWDGKVEGDIILEHLHRRWWRLDADWE